jgi:hypothetical protein
MLEMVFRETGAFSRDMKKLSPDERQAVVNKLNQYTEQYQRSGVLDYRHVHKLHSNGLPAGWDTSLYVLRIDHRLRVVLAIDEDPIFEQIIITLFRSVPNSDLPRAYNGVAESLYQSFLAVGTQGGGADASN